MLMSRKMSFSFSPLCGFLTQKPRAGKLVVLNIYRTLFFVKYLYYRNGYFLLLKIYFIFKICTIA